MDYRFLLEDDLSLTPVGEFDYITQNSAGTKRLYFHPNGWAPAEGETLAVAFERKKGNEEYFRVDPIQLGKVRDKNQYFTIIPDEVVLLSGEWEMCVYKRLNYDEEAGVSDADLVGEKFAFCVINTVRDGNGKPVTKYDLANMAQFQRDLEGGYYAARGIFPWQEGFVYGEGEIAFFGQIAGQEFGAFVRSLVSDNASPPYDEEGNLNENWKEELNLNHVTEDFFSVLKDLEDAVGKQAQAAKSAAENAKQSAEDAKNAAGNIAELKNRTVHYVQVLPDEGVEGEAYAVIKDTDGNIFDLYMLQDGDWVYLGGERFLANGWKRFQVFLPHGNWAEGRQEYQIPFWTNGWAVDAVFPSDESALAYLTSGIRFAGESDGVLTFTCIATPDEDVMVIVDVKVEYSVPTLSNYYTIPQTDEAIDSKIAALVNGADGAYDTLKEIADYIAEDKEGAARLLKQAETNAHDIAEERKERMAETAKKQDAATDELDTDSKTVVGAINEHEELLARVREEVPSTHTVTVEIGPDDWHGRSRAFYALDYPELAEITLDSRVTCIATQASSVLALLHGIKMSAHAEGSVTFTCDTVPPENYTATIIIKNIL